MNNFNITDYLVPADIAKWAKEKGFDGECTHFYDKNDKSIYLTRHSAHISNRELTNSFSTATTFQQFFDWCEEEFGVKAVIDGDFKINNWVFIIQINSPHFKTGDLIAYKTKRDAQISACNAIKEYVEKLK